ncbi:winged helix-turn-helix domain-containing protein [Streptomyces sp900105755]|uniref:Winged helix-turn-helix domain-containing protein n=1 Tax=Streptomyces sp. 900105755 TaxID=3154389 RepID=A0ABV1TWY7_9ACTN
MDTGPDQSTDRLEVRYRLFIGRGLLHRHGWSWQSLARRALERDEHAVELWKKDVWPQVE